MGDRLTMMWTDGVYDTFGPVDVVDNEYSKINYEKQLTKLGKYEDTGLEPEEVHQNMKTLSSLVEKYSDRLAEYQQAEEDGLLVKLPCKVGDMLYLVPSKVNYELNVINNYEKNNRIYELIVDEVRFFSNGRYLLSTRDRMQCVVSDMFNETWFLTRTEAEAKLAELEGEHE